MVGTHSSVIHTVQYLDEYRQRDVSLSCRYLAIFCLYLVALFSCLHFCYSQPLFSDDEQDHGGDDNTSQGDVEDEEDNEVFFDTTSGNAAAAATKAAATAADVKVIILTLIF